MPYNDQHFKASIKLRASFQQQKKIYQDLPLYDTLSTPVQTALWLHTMIDNMAGVIGEDAARSVMEACGQQCLGNSVLEKARRLKSEASSIDELLLRLNAAHIGGGKLQRVGDVIRASYERCYCGSVSKTRQPISKIYCQCSCGWYKKLFEALLEKSVNVELLASIINGADSCQFVIQL